MKWVSKCQTFLLLLLSCIAVFATQNAYRHHLTLLQKEPSSGAYAKAAAAAVEERWLTQPLDHFDVHNKQSWKMRYLRNARYHKPQAPIYIFVGGEWSITPGLLITGLTHDMAVENAGMLYYTEHRYYGKSWPVGHNHSLADLKYLSLPQALADLAYFINYQKSHSVNLTNSKTILVGGSYSGSMVTWMLELYPELIAASWASSAPLLAKADFYEYMQMVSASITLSYGSNCTERIALGLHYIAQQLQQDQAVAILQRLNACTSFDANNEWDRAAFFNGIGNYFALIVQSHSHYISSLCETLMSLHENHNEAMLLFLELIYAAELKSHNCLDFSYKAMLQVLNNSTAADSDTRAWFYQTCTEFGWYTTTVGSTSSSFGNQVPLTYFQRLCSDAFQPDYNLAQLAQGIAQTNAQFGGHDFNQSTRYQRVYFTHGQLDPWRALGQQNGHQALVIPAHSHVEDLASINVQDSISLNFAKLNVMSFLRKHLQLLEGPAKDKETP